LNLFISPFVPLMLGTIPKLENLEVEGLPVYSKCFPRRNGWDMLYENA
jgi:hypothetical protein